MHCTYALREQLYAVHGLIVVDGQAIAINVGSLTGDSNGGLVSTYQKLCFENP
jgi:hypothetical protein